MLFLAITMIIMLIPDGKKWELWECLFAITLLSVFVNPHNTNAQTCWRQPLDTARRLALVTDLG